MKFCSAILCIFILTSCTQQRLALRFADTAASWKADDYFDLSRAQKDKVEENLKSFVKRVYEHNDREIAKMFDLSDEVLGKVDDSKKIDCAEVGKIKTQAEKIFAELPKLSAVHVQTLTESLSEEQILYFVKQANKKIEEEDRKSKKIADLEEDRLERSLKSIRLFLGHLSEEQRSAIERHFKAHVFPFEERLKNRKINFEKLKVSAASKDSFIKFVVDYLQNWRSHQTAVFLKQADELRLQNEQFYQNLVCEASNKQLKHLRKKLASFKKDFEEFFIN